MPPDDDLVRLARGLQQANSRLTRVLSLLEGSHHADAALGPLLDLLAAVDAAITTTAEPATREGLSVARAAATEALAAAGLFPVPTEGAFDPATQRAVEVADHGAPPGQILKTHARGWVRRGDDDAPIVVRAALVTVQSGA